MAIKTVCHKKSCNLLFLCANIFLILYVALCASSTTFWCLYAHTHTHSILKEISCAILFVVDFVCENVTHVELCIKASVIYHCHHRWPQNSESCVFFWCHTKKKKTLVFHHDFCFASVNYHSVKSVTSFPLWFFFYDCLCGC